MPPKFYKQKILLDEGLYPRQYLKRINSRHNTKHIKHDLNKAGITDEEVVDIAAEQKRLIVTYNVDDFKKLLSKNPNVGIIGVTQKMLPEQLDKKLNALLSRNTTKSLLGKYTSLSGII